MAEFSELTVESLNLQPAAVWRHFAGLCATPRPSKGEGALRHRLATWATGQGLASEIDAAGNLLIRKPASADGAHLPAMALQAHLDMVCQANAGHDHDFKRDPVRPRLRDGWLVADQTTLGADNGIGVALMLAVLEDRTLTHGPLEVLLTVDEEAGMGGARGLGEGWLQARRMLNLDTEAWGEFYLGCAGGLDVDVIRSNAPQPVPAGHLLCRVTLSGLRGGHSGVDIHEERGNAVKLLVRVLCALQSRLPVRLAELAGGNARNAIPREAAAVLAVPAGETANLRSRLEQAQRELEEAFFGIETAIRLELEMLPLEPGAEVMDPVSQHQWLHALNGAPYGVWRMSRRVPGVVETSNNVGIVRIGPAQGTANFMVRSLLGSGALTLAREIASIFALAAAEVAMSGHYPGWAPNPDSPLLRLCQQVYTREFGGDSAVRVIHAGLECGLIADKYPDMDIVSFGPDIRGAHAPGEAVEVASVGRVWQLLCAILAAPPAA